jgi:ketosteroid isomerase-like protein
MEATSTSFSPEPTSRASPSGRAAIRDDFLSKVGPLSGGTFKADLVEVAVGHAHVVAVQHATAEFRGKALDITACQLIRVADGKIVEMRGHYSDQYALDDFWS